MPTDFNTKTLSAVEVSDRLIIYPPNQAQTVIGREDTVLAAIGLYGISQLVAQSLPLPAQAIIGRFSQADYDSFKQNATYGIALWPLPQVKMIENYHPAWRHDPIPAVSLIATTSHNQVALSGTVTSGLNIAVLTGAPLRSATFTTTADDTLTTVAATIATTLTSLGATASASGPTVTTNMAVTVRIGAVGTLWREASRLEQHIQISVWSGVEELRAQIGDALRSVIGTISRPRINIDSRSDAFVKYIGNRRMDDDEIDSLWVYHLIVAAQYAIIETQSAYPVLAPSLSVLINNQSAFVIDI